MENRTLRVLEFNTVREMDRTIISNWNNKVNKEDDIYVLGDFFMGCLEDIEPILSRLKGKIHLIRGNHDQNNRIRIFKEYGIDIQDIAYLKYKGKFFILCHFPMTDEEFKEMITSNHSETIFLYGHVHGDAPTGYYKNTYHVGADTNNLTPVSIEQIYLEATSPM